MENNKHLSFDAGGYCKGFETFVLNNVIYPELTTDLYDRYSVPLTFRIAMDESVYDIKGVSNDYISDFKSRYTTNSYITNDVDFVEEATRLIKLSGSWTPCTYHGVYVNVERIYFFNFVYHKEYFSRDMNGFVLNPDVKPEYNGEREIYDNIVNPPGGCDGFVTFIAIVELDGKLSNEYWIDCQGKTNPGIGLRYLSKLTSWKPAIKDGKEVRSQIIIRVTC
ncbi:MAG: hypothetical protein U0V54_12855 [Saprospiraceae bacterium]|nr:hypothetical protein [Bacteroidia bacterium]